MVIHPSKKAGWFVARDTDGFLDNLFASTMGSYAVKEGAVWFIPKEFLLPVVRAGYSRFGHVDYRLMPASDQVKIAQVKGDWSKDVEISAVKSLNESSPHAILFLLETAPPAIVKAAWKELSKLEHPDRGGDPIKFDQIQKAYEEIRGREDQQRDSEGYKSKENKGN